MRNSNIFTQKKIHTTMFIGMGLILIFLGLVFSISVGAKNIGFSEVIKYVLKPDLNSMESQIIWDLRLPRALCAIFIGGFIACSGSVLQGISNNPIASPYMMGVTQGSCLAVSIYMAYEPVPGPLGKVLCAFLGALISAVFIFALSMKKSNINITRMILAGTSIGMLFLSIAYVIALLTNNTKNLGFWIAGSLSASTWENFKIIFFIAIFVLPYIIMLSPKIMILNLGDENAIGLGENPNKIRVLSLLGIIILSGTSAALGGNIGFVCLIVPQISRLLIGFNYKYVIPLSIIFGSSLLLYSDIFARIIAKPFEVPVGAITSIIGVPVLIMLVRKGNRV